MIVRALAFYLGKLRCGLLCQYDVTDTEKVTTFIADPSFVRVMEQPNAPTLSLALRPGNPAQAAAFFANMHGKAFSGRYSNSNGWLLPAFWQNLLPEGVFRDRVAEMRGCDPKDHMEMLAACGRGLPGNVSVAPHDLTSRDLARVVTQDNDALETSVFAVALAQGESLSGVQPKLAVMLDGDRFVARTTDKSRDTNIIAKLPVVGQPRLPELEELSLRLAKAAGVDACHAYLAPLERLAVDHNYDLGEVDAQTLFLAVERFDRVKVGGRSQRIHWEDCAQLLSMMPEEKYQGSYAEVAAIMMTVPSLGTPAVLELLRRLAVSEMIGNVDMHLKNMGLIYKDGITPTLAPAFDVVGYSAYSRRTGHAIALLIPESSPAPAKATKKPAAAPAGGTTKPSLTPSLVRTFCAQTGLLETLANKTLRDCAALAYKLWPEMISTSALTPMQKRRLLDHFFSHPWIEQLSTRASRASKASP